MSVIAILPARNYVSIDALDGNGPIARNVDSSEIGVLFAPTA
jgi:hypothetical protein